MVNEAFRNPCRPAKFAGSKLPDWPSGTGDGGQPETSIHLFSWIFIRTHRFGTPAANL
jgi:hypothetical protein